MLDKALKFACTGLDIGPDGHPLAGRDPVAVAQDMAEAKGLEDPEAPPKAEDLDDDPARALPARIVSVLRNRRLSPRERNTYISQMVVDALIARGSFYYHADCRDFPTAMFFDSEAKRLEHIRHDAFTAWLTGWTGVNKADKLHEYIMGGVETAALTRGTAILPEAYWAARPGAFYLSSGPAAMVKIEAGTDPVAVDNGTDGVLFTAGQTLNPWHLTDDPLSPFQTCRVFKNASCAAGHGQDLLKLWLYSLPTCPDCKPTLCLTGEVGSGKTKLVKAVAELYGLPYTAQNVEESKASDFWPAMNAGGLVCMDNADTRCRWLTDALASASTDGGTQRRKLYTDGKNADDMVRLRARAWPVLTTANPTFANDAGLADRLLVVRMNRREGQTADGALTAEVLAHRDAMLTYIAGVLSLVLEDAAAVPVGLNKRHPDFAAFAVRLGRVLGREAEAVAALRAAEADKAAFCLENDTIGAALIAYIADAGDFNGNAARLQTQLALLDPALLQCSAKSFGRRCAALWPHIASMFKATRVEARGGWRFQIAPLHL